MIVNAYDPHFGWRAAASTHANANGAWTVSFALLYNTDIQVYSNGRITGIYVVTEIPAFHVLRVSYLKHDSHGYHYRLDGHSSSKVPGELVQLLRNGHVIGSGHMSSAGYFSIYFTVPTRSTSYLLQLRWSGNSSSGMQYVMPGTSGRFHG